MLRSEKSIEIDAPVETVFAYLSDPTHAPDSDTSIEVKDIQRLPSGGYRYTTVDKFLGLRSETTNEDVEVVPNERLVSTFHSALLNGTGDMRFERLTADKTRVRCVGEISIPGGPLARFGEPFLSRYLSHAMEMNLETAKVRIEVGIPTGAAS